MFFKLLIIFALVFTARGARWVIHVRDGNASAFAEQHGVQLVGPVAFLPVEDNLYVFDGTLTPLSLTRAEHSDSFYEEQVLRQRMYTRARKTPNTDPLYIDQWHLHTHPYSIDADHAGPNIDGRGVTVAIVDDGVQHTHPELHDNFSLEHSYDFNDDDNDPQPNAADQGHGTACAGVVAGARNNGHCGRGAAPAARLVGVRLIAAPVTDLTEAAALSHNAISEVDVYSCSWGPYDDGRGMVAPGYLTQRALASNAGGMRGRFGKGSVYVWAAGNGRHNGDSCAFDGYASNPYVMAIGAIDHTGNQSWYSESCAALMAVMPSSGAMRGIVTSDLMGSQGYTADECTTTFGGTSAAAPLAAGVIALLLQAHPEFTWRDVRHVVARAAIPVVTDDADWNHNTAGYHHSHRYGFGILKVPALLSYARTHERVPSPHKTWLSPVRHVNSANIPCTFNETVHGSGLKFLEVVALEVNVEHPDRGAVTIDLQSPENVISHLAMVRPQDGTIDYPPYGWQFVSVRHWGETHADGTWFIMTNDARQPLRGHIKTYQLKLMGY